MKENELKYNIGELASASLRGKMDDELAEKKRIQRNALIKMGTMGILTLLLLIFSSIDSHTF